MSESMPEQTDVLVVGSGLAGCVAALAAARNGAQVTLITRERDANSTNTSYAQGGIIFRGKNDNPDLLVNDILEAGAGLSNRAACEVLAQEGPKLVRRYLIDEFGVPFDREPGGDLDLTEEGAHSQPRIIHVADLTGKSIQERTLEAVSREPNVHILAGVTAVDLLKPRHSADSLDIYRPERCYGAYVLNRETGETHPIVAHETILATGGLGQLFLHTTNPRGARGDGIAMAYRAGARVLNLEFIQFHPTALFHPEAQGFLISESVRGEGGVLVRRNGERFMDAIHPKGSLAPRDVVARAIHDTLMLNDESCVYIDLTHKDSAWIRQRFPNIYKKCLSLGIDITANPIPVVPAAHYSCGGAAVDLEGRTSINGLWAAGEVSCTGIHGANRLASTSLLEALVWGHRAGERSAQKVRQHPEWLPKAKPWVMENEDVDPALIFQDWLTIRYTMWNYVGVARSQKRMARAKQILRELQLEIEDFYARARLSDNIVGLRNGAQTAVAVLYAAQANHRSRGCHYLVEEP